MSRHRKSNTRFLIGAILGALVALLAASPALAQDQVKPRLLIVFDNSGSMAWNIAGNSVYGDGSNDSWTGGRYCCPGNGGSRIYIAKEAMRQMIFASGDIEFGLTKFVQTYSAAGPGWQATCGTNCYTYYGNQANGSRDVLRYHDDTSDSFSQTDPARGLWLLVGFGAASAESNPAQVLMWMDNHEYSSSSLGQPDTNALSPDGYEQELRADGNTPLGNLLQAVYYYLINNFLSENAPSATKDPYRTCRKYSVIILTDGEANGPGDPSASVSWAGYLYNMGPNETSVNDAIRVDSWVIGLAINSGNLDNMATAGGAHYDPAQSGHHAFFANSQASLSSILYQVVAGSIKQEICNNLDDDCDGLTDEGFTKYCNKPGNPNLTECVKPVETLCDGIDNNCDGQTDEGNPQGGVQCGASNTPPCRYGVSQCQNGGVICLGNIDPQTETCNGLNDDCDGLIDEGVVWNPAWGSDVCGGSNVGVCQYKRYTCTGGKWTCAGGVTPGTEGTTTCDGLDNDCDGSTDEGISRKCAGGPAGHENDGICRQGNQYCNPSGGGWNAACAGGVGPRTEACNGLDDDCDGTTDEGLATGAECGGGPGANKDEGECQHGHLSCVSGALTCTGAIGPVAEPATCDDKDNNCDGQTDEGIRQPCGGGTHGDPNAGQCQQGWQYCNPSGTGWGSCQGAIGESAEVCDNIDNDCDTQIDEGLSTGADCGGATTGNQDEGACQHGHIVCAGGILSCNGSTGPGIETCNGLDDDCDGATDEGLYRDCHTGTYPDDVGICHYGVQSCKNGKWGAGNPWSEGGCEGEVKPQSPELCNDMDDDCDGTTDESPGGLVGQQCDQCGDEWECVFVGGHWQLQCNGTGASPEVCNGLDDNCNTFVDEGLHQVCGGCDPVVYPPPSRDCTTDPNEGECQQGIRLCDATVGSGVEHWETQCRADVGPVDELCDAKDNDCDGLTDEEDEIDGAGEACGLDVGECEPGEQRCVDDGSGGASLECCALGQTDCIEPQGPEDEVCNGKDDDCDGETDEDLPNVGLLCGKDLGICKAGITQCVKTGDTWGIECVGATSGTDETCNALDDDCDGQTDEDLTNGATCTNSQTQNPNEGVCKEGEFVCVNGVWECNANKPAKEI
ncbi:MAG: MopE-related protein, partial [Deltaproteobacteria bacterium]|nr:MopE-related protein [Deltaproteobacteria bacterium]